MRTIVACVLALVACRAKEEAATKPAPVAEQKPPAVDPWQGVDAAPETPETRKARAEAAVGRVAQILPKLSKLRGLELLHPIPAEYQTNDDFRAFVHREVDKERAKDKDIAEGLLQMGLLTEPIDLAQAEEQAFTSQAAAYYDPAQKKFFLVMVPDSPMMLDVTSAHELTHGLQDQHFDLRHYLAEDANGHSTLDDDANAARHFIVEGDATFSMMLYSLADGREVNPRMLKMLRVQLELFGSSDTTAMLDDMAQQTFGSGSGELVTSMKAMRDIPRTILVPMLDSYMKGALVALAAYERDGWRGVDALYTDPPESTEQVLHPRERLLGRRDRPRHVTLPKLDGYTEVTSNVLGELQWQVYFSLWKHQGDEHVSENWGGDRYAFVRGKDGAPVVLIATAWDTPNDARLFAEAYSSTIAARTAAKAHRGKIWVRADDTHVFIVDGGQDASLIDALAARAKIDR